MKYGLLFILSIIFCLSATAQSWNISNERSIPQRGKRDIIPSKYIISQLDDTKMREILWAAPAELRFNPKTDQHTTIEIMLADGTIDKFSVVEYKMMEPSLALKYPDIKTFKGISQSDRFRKVRIDYTVHGFRAVVTDQSGQTFIDHYQRGDKSNKVIYKKNDYPNHDGWKCDFQSTKEHDDKEKIVAPQKFSGDCIFRSYRLSVTATGEYSNFHGANMEAESGLVLSAVTTTVNRVNDVFEQDITTRFILIDNNDDIFYYDPSTDPFNGTNAGSMITQNQTNTDAIIGSANYDLGHIFSTGGSGLAGLGVICSNGGKARGVTGIANPVNDPFDIDYVAHEMGHQLGANHTQNNSCNINGSTAMEPGSASTIMGYAGICNPNVQNNSDAYFHAISIQEMNAEITGTNCHVTLDLDNQAPTVDALSNKSIPHSTSFVLEAVGSDNDGDAITYNWEQMDNEVGAIMPPASTNSVGPMFRSLFATADPKRYFPSIDNIIDGSTDEWETLPTIGRVLDFRVTVRDHGFSPGCTAEQDVTITTVANAGPFVVTSNDNTPWLESQTVTIEWDVAGTNVAPIDCDNVDILLSYDGGNTYPVTMSSNEINDGSADVVVPLGTSSTARVMVKCSDNIFFDINNSDFSINLGSPSFTMSINPESDNVCEEEEISFTLETESILGYNQVINVSLNGLPSGVNSNIVDNTLIPGESTMITVGNLNGQSGLINITVNGSSGITSRNVSYDLTVINVTDAPSLSVPADGTIESMSDITLTWNEVVGAANYEYELSTSSNGGNIVFTGMTTQPSIDITGLAISTLYYWRTRSVNDCGTSDWSSEWTFETGQCYTFSSTDLPIGISSSGTPTVTSDLNVQQLGAISDINLTGLIGTHSYLSDLNFTLISPDGTRQEIWDQPCNSQNNFNINFDDEAANNNYPCPPTDGGTYIPDNSLDVFDNKEMQGLWILEILDDANVDGGELTSWSLNVCVETVACDLTVDRRDYVVEEGSLLSALKCASNGDVITLESTIPNSVISTNGESILIEKNITIMANRSDNIRLICESNDYGITVASGFTLTLIGFDFESIDAINGVIINNGELVLEDMNVFYNAGPSIVNNTDSSVITKGDCSVIEE